MRIKHRNIIMFLNLETEMRMQGDVYNFKIVYILLWLYYKHTILS